MFPTFWSKVKETWEKAEGLLAAIDWDDVSSGEILYEASLSKLTYCLLVKATKE